MDENANVCVCVHVFGGGGMRHDYTWHNTVHACVQNDHFFAISYYIFWNEKCYIFILHLNSIKFVPKAPIERKSQLPQVKSWRRLSVKYITQIEVSAV